MGHAIFHTHQTIGACAGVCTCDCMHKMEKTALISYSSEDSCEDQMEIMRTLLKEVANVMEFQKIAEL